MNINFPDDILSKNNTELKHMILKVGPKVFASWLVEYLTSNEFKREKNDLDITTLEKIASVIEITIALSDLKREFSPNPSKPNPVIKQDVVDSFLSTYEKRLEENKLGGNSN